MLDEDIPKDILCEYLKESDKKGRFGFDLSCDEQQDETFISTKDLYRSNVDEEDVNKDC